MRIMGKILTLLGRNVIGFVTISFFIILIAFFPLAVDIKPGVQDTWVFDSSLYAREMTSYVSDLAQGDLGTIPVRQRWMETLPNGLNSLIEKMLIRSIKTIIPSMVFGVLVGVLFAVISAFLPNWAKRGLDRSNQLLFSIPDLLIIFILQFLAVEVDKLAGGVVIQMVELSNRPALMLPVLCVATPIAAYIYRYSVQACREAANQEYVRTARAKGLPNSYIFFKHILRPALDSILAVAPKMLAVSASSLLIVERLFNITGITYFFTGLNSVAFMTRMLTTTLLVLAMIVMLTNITTSLLRLWINPALRK